MIISNISLKGGSGKTTTSVNLAVELATRGYKVVLVDSDPNNQNSIKWSGFRDKSLPKVTTVSISNPQALRNNIYDLEATCDYLIIDGTPALAELTGSIMLVSDLCLLPLKASTWDIWAFNDQFIPKYNDILSLKPDLDCRIVLNAIRKSKKISKDVSKIVEDYDIPVMKSKIGDRTSFEVSPMFGQGVQEYGDDLASNEIRLLANECIEILQNKTVEV